MMKPCQLSGQYHFVLLVSETNWWSKFSPYFVFISVYVMYRYVFNVIRVTKLKAFYMKVEHKLDLIIFV
jgi:hypothetical protein